tara:strand:+ start:1 stop:1347 length:1347 start_codon:yes stop_codon:yes gene_type:complete
MPGSIPLIHGAKANVKKGAWYKTLDISAGAPSVQMEIDKHEHAMRRRFLQPAFSERALKEAERLICVSARKLCQGLTSSQEEGQWSEPKNFNDWATYFGFDFVSNLGYGKSFGMLDNIDNRWIPGVLKSASIFLYYVGYLPFVDFVRPLMGTWVQDYIGGQAAADSLKYTNLANERLAERTELEQQRKMDDKDIGRKDTFHYLLNSKDSVTGKTFTTEQLQADSALIIAAGSDGVAVTLAACMFYLLNDPHAMKRLTEEIREIFLSVEEISNPKLGSLPYLHACLEETLRMSLPKPSSLPREVLKGGLLIDGYLIPQGINVGSPLYVIHHDPDMFPEPWVFRPERWISSSSTGVTPEDVSAAKAAYAPFLIGPMNCIGKNISYITLKLALAHLLLKHEVKLSGKTTGGGNEYDVDELRRKEGEHQMTDWILGFRDGPIVQTRVIGAGT